MKKRNKKFFSIMVFAMISVLIFSNSVFAFQDVKNSQVIQKLQQEGVIQGMGRDLFSPTETVTNAQAVQFIVRGLKLNFDTIRFIKAPKASDYFTKVSDNAWYADAFAIAHFYKLPIDKDMEPNKNITREDFADLVFKSMLSKGEYAFIDLYILISDESAVDKADMNSVQKLIITKIAALDDKQNFRPKKSILRSEAALWIYNLMQFVEKNKDNVQPLPCSYAGDVALTSEAINKEVNKVTLKASLPSPGYGIFITSIEFGSDKSETIIHYGIQTPDPDKVFAQVISEKETSTFLSSDQTPSIQCQN
jgi:hypothetical protein